VPAAGPMIPAIEWPQPYISHCTATWYRQTSVTCYKFTVVKHFCTVSESDRLG